MTVSPSAIVSGAPGQSIRVTAEFNGSLEGGELLVRLRRPQRDSTPAAPRGQSALVVATRTLPVAGAGARRSLDFAELDPPAGRYRIDFVRREAGERGRDQGGVPVDVYGQHRLLPEARLAVGTKAAPESPADVGTASLVGDEVNNNVSNLTGEQEETYVAVRPDDPSRVIAAVNPVEAFISNDYMRPGTAVRRTLPSSTLMPSDEGGGTASLPLCCDPSLAADTLGNLWYLVLATGPKSHVVVNRAAAGTTTFQASNVAVPRVTKQLQDKPMMTIDNHATSPKFGTLYVVWNENSNFGQNTVVSQCTTRPGGVSDPANCDTPANWTEPVPVTSSTGSYIYASVAAAPNGDLYVAWQDYSSDNDIEIDRCLAAANCSSAASWGADTDVDNLDASGGSALPFFCPIIPAPAGRVGPQPYVDVGPDGRVYVAFSDLRANGTTKCTEASTDRTFDSYIARGSSPNAFPAVNTGIRLSDDSSSASNNHFFPSLTVDQSTGEVQSSLYSTKADAARGKTHQYVVTSTDGGASYGAMQQITTAQSDYSGSNSTPNDYGDYQGSDSAQGRLFPVWTDNRAAHGGDAELYMDSAPVETTITSGPTGTTDDPTPTFEFSSTSSPGSFECRVDAAAFAACTSPHTTPALADGAHTFEVRASYTNSGGVYTDPSPASRSFTVETVPPDPCQGVPLWPGSGSGNDTVTGTAGDDVIFTGDGDDTIHGLGGNDTICGGNGTDRLDGGPGNDRLDGGGAPGDTANVLDYSAAAGSVTVNLQTAQATGDGTDTLVNRFAEVDGSPNNDALTGRDDNTSLELLVGNAGNDTLTGGAGGDQLMGGAGADALNGGPDNDTLNGGDANDTFDGGTGADAMNGAAGTDTVTYAGRVAPVAVDIDGVSDDGETGEADNVKTDVENLTGGAGSDSLTGNAATNNGLNGGNGADVLSGLGGTDTAIYGGRSTAVTVAINDVADDGNSSDGPAGARDNIMTDIENLTGGGGADMLSGSAAANSLNGGNGADVLSGLGGIDTASYASRTTAVTVDLDDVADDGNSSDGPAGARDNVMTDIERLTGGAGDDTLTGSSANNTLDGGNGADVLSGLGGIDTASYGSRTTAVTVAINDVADDGNASDGPAGARDNVTGDIENVTGGKGPDTLTGSPVNNRLTGGLGADALFGLGGNDILFANDGVADAQIDCDGGTDTAHVDGADPAPVGCETVGP